MIRLFPYIRRYTLPITLAILFLFIQANVDLALPDYLSKIVNIGIQQEGVSSALPEVLSERTYQRLSLFLDVEGQARLEKIYQHAGAAEIAALQKRYPGLTAQSLYLLQGEIPSTFESSLMRALLSVSFLQRAQEDPKLAAQMAQQMGFNLPAPSSGVDLFTALERMPLPQRQGLLEALRRRFDVLGESMLRQMSIAATRAEYQTLGVDLSALQRTYLLRTGGIMLLLTLFSALLTILVGLISARVAAGAARDLREALFVRVSDFSLAEMERFSTASLITRATNDVSQLQMVTMLIIRLVFYAPILAMGGMIRALNTAPSMGWIIGLMVVVLMGIILGVFSVTLPRFKLIQTLMDNLNRILRENLTGIMVVRAFNRQEHERERFDRANRELTQVNLFVNRVMVIMMPLMMFLMSAVSVLVLWVGAHQVADLKMQVGDMMAFMQYTMQIFFAFMFMSMMFIVLPRASVSAERIADVLETPLSIQDPPAPRRWTEPFRGEVEFRNVSFRYPDAEEDVLHNISFVARPGQTIGIIGTTGSGKSTLVRLIPRFYDVTAGAILIDGVDIRQVRQRDLREKIGYVPQKSNLFSGTMESNLRFGDENAPQEALLEALEIAQGQEILASRPEGLAAPIAQGGTNVSGGQRQRLAIARALVKRAPIYIFDDSFSALDYRTDLALRRALKKYLSKSTIFIVSQRVATIKDADQILVLDEGRLIGMGTHEELLETCEVYRDIALSQLKQEALA
ncbi:MAG: ABC transporter ATP-binding protein [Anaerolineales bacterium]